MDMTSLSRKYAAAWIHHYQWYDQDFSWMEKLSQLTHFLLTHRRRFVYEPLRGYALVFKNFELHNFDTRLIMMMLEKEQRMFLLPDILYEVVYLYKKQHGIESCIVTSACELTPEQKRVLENTLEKKTKKRLLYSYEIDDTLIAGIRVRGENFIYEDSVKQRLHALEKGRYDGCL